MKGYIGKVLWVNLSSGEIITEEIADEVYEKFLSGYGLAAKILYERIPAGADPLGPDNILGFMSGLLTATGCVFTGRWMVCAKSPLTGGWGDANCGGTLAPAIKQAGVDGIFFTGISDKPVYVVVDEDKVELCDASEIWGQDCFVCEDSIREQLQDSKGQFKIACIGPAGEKLSFISGISNDKGRYASRSGLGAVMGCKRLKAIAIRGRKKVKAHNPKQIKELTKKFTKALTRADFMMKVLNNRVLRLAGKIARIGPPSKNPGDLWRIILKKYGTSGITALSAENGDSPVKNWSGIGFTDFPLDCSSKISDDALIHYEVKKYGCYSCPIKCGGIVAVNEGDYPLKESHKPEYETLCSFGALCLVDDLHSLLKINDLCNRGGVDSISCGALVAFTIECCERGILTQEQVGDLHLHWGNAPAIVKLVEKIIHRQGIGDILADGVKKAAQKIGQGSEQWAIHAGGQEIPMHDARFDLGYGIAYECEPTPGRHTIASYTWQDLIGLERYFADAQPIKFLTSRKKRIDPAARITNQVLNSKLVQIANGAGICIFGIGCGPKMPIFEWINAATGWNKTAKDYLLIGERIQTMRHSFNLREGIKPKDFKMTERAIGKPPLERGPHSGVTLDMDTACQLFYQAYEWDPQSGQPTPAALQRLGLQCIIAPNTENS